MIKKAFLCAAAVGASVLLASSGAAQANPATPMTTIESSAAQLCAYINSEPTDNGVIEGMGSLGNGGLDEADAMYVVMTAIHHVCPQHQELVMNSMMSIAEEEICTEQT